MMKKLILLALISASTAGLDAADKTYKLESGRVLVNPYILFQTPAGIEVGHRDGIVHLRLKELPADLQKELGYDEAKARAFEASEQEARQEQIRKDQEKKKQQNEIIRQQLDALAKSAGEGRDEQEIQRQRAAATATLKSLSSKANIFKKIHQHRKRGHHRSKHHHRSRHHRR